MIKKFYTYNKINENLYTIFRNNIWNIKFRPESFSPYDLFCSLTDIDYKGINFYNSFLKWYLTGRNIAFKAAYIYKKGPSESYNVRGEVQKIRKNGGTTYITINNTEHILLIIPDIIVYNPDPDALSNFLNYLDEKEKVDIEIYNKIDPYGEENWEDMNELFDGVNIINSLKKDLKIIKYGNKRGHSFYIKDLYDKFNKKKLIQILKNKLIGKRVQFYYDINRGIDGITTVKEIMTIENIIDQGFDMLELSRFIEFRGIPEVGSQNSLIINKNYPITILNEKTIRYTEDDPYGEDDWDDDV